MILRTVGRIFIGAGVLILLFLAYELVGTNFVAKQHQKSLVEDLERSWEAAAVPAASDPESPATEASPAQEPGSTNPTPQPQAPRKRPAPRRLDPGDGIGVIEIPRIDVRQVVVEGIGVNDLKKGPGHYPGTAMPGEQGNVVISGHRTTYGAPFYRLNEVGPGDEVMLSTPSNVYTYRVTGTRIVAADDTTVVVRTDDARLSLTTCHPRFSARQRLIVIAELVASAPRAA